MQEKKKKSAFKIQNPVHKHEKRRSEVLLEEDLFYTEEKKNKMLIQRLITKNEMQSDRTI